MRNVLPLMLTCGMYQSAGEWAARVGLPAKSGVSGNILAVSPGRLAIAVYSPRIDSAGNSVRGQAFFAALVQELPELSLFLYVPPCRLVLRCCCLATCTKCITLFLP